MSFVVKFVFSGFLHNLKTDRAQYFGPKMGFFSKILTLLFSGFCVKWKFILLALFHSAQIPYLANWFLNYDPKCSQPIRF